MRLHGLLGVAAVVLATTGPAVADTVATTSGQVFAGKVLEETPEKVVIKTESGTVTVPRAAIASVTKAEAAPQEIVPAVIKPAEADKAFEDAKAAFTRKEWVRAGSLLEGLLQLSVTAFPNESRLAATVPLVNCYLAVRDARGASKTFRRRADLVSVESDRRRLLATAEALEKVGGLVIGDKTAGTCEEAIEASMAWKAAQLVVDAKDVAAKATSLNEMDKLEAAANRCIERLKEADLYVPGFAAGHRKEVLAALADNIVKAGRTAVRACTEERQSLGRLNRTAAPDVNSAMDWNNRASRYMAVRQAAEHGLKNLKVLADKVPMTEVYAEREKECAELLAKLEELRFLEQMPGQEKTLIDLRQIGAPYGRGR